MFELYEVLEALQVELVEQDGQVLDGEGWLETQLQLLLHHRVLAVQGLGAGDLGGGG